MTHFIKDNPALRPEKSNFQTQSSVPADRKVASIDWNELRQSLLDTRDYLRSIVVNVCNYGAKGDGVTDDTAAIQAAIDAAYALGGLKDAIVFLPASPTPYMFSNLKLPAYTTLQGAHMGQTTLKRIPGSTGNAITEKTVAEGNANGAISIWIRDLSINGNGTVGNGIDLGYQVPGVNFETWASLQNVLVQNFTSGIGIHIDANAIHCHYVYALNNQDGLHITGGYSQFHTVYGEQNSRYQLRAAGTAHAFFGVHCEPGISTDPAILIEGGAQCFYGVSIYSTKNRDKQIVIASGVTKTQLHDVFITGGTVYTHGIYHESYANARTGTVPYIAHYQMGETGAVAEWYVNATNGKVDTKTGDGNALGGTLDVTGQITGNGGIKSAGGSSGVAAAIASTKIEIESSSDAALSFRGPSANYKALFFGNGSSNVDGGVVYDSSTTPRGLEFRTGGNATRLSINSGGLITLNGGPTIRTGAGSPEGVFAAPVGSLYLRTDGGAGTTFYVKESGTGSTGWVAK